jgi:ABC-type Mn2+/Zn2+ transport system permease subunit
MFEPVFMRLALIAAVATGASLGLMGVYLVIRRVVFLGLVLANVATMGSALAQLFGWPPEAASIIAAVTAALALGALPVPRRVSAESFMGWAYAAASSATVLILARAAKADADTLHLLFGNLLAVSFSHAAGLVLVALAIGLVHMLFRRRFLLVTFDPEAATVADEAAA